MFERRGDRRAAEAVLGESLWQHEDKGDEYKLQFDRAFNAEYEAVKKKARRIDNGSTLGTFCYHEFLQVQEDLQTGKALTGEKKAIHLGVSLGKLFATVEWGITNSSRDWDLTQHIEKHLVMMASNIKQGLEALGKRIPTHHLEKRIQYIANHFSDLKHNQQILIVKIAMQF